MGKSDDRRVADFDPSDALPDADFPIADLQNFNPEATLFGPPFILATVTGFGVKGEYALSKLEQKVRKRAGEAESGRFNKTDALYSPIAPPPGAWDYRCSNCRFYQEGRDDDGGGHCAIVGHEEDPFGGRSINPEAWCAYWLPIRGTPFLQYLKNVGEGKDS